MDLRQPNGPVLGNLLLAFLLIVSGSYQLAVGLVGNFPAVFGFGNGFAVVVALQYVAGAMSW